MSGYEKLKGAVEKDCAGGSNCFNPAGCDKGKYPQRRCSHKYCDKFAWIIARAKHYAESTGLNWEDILDAWEAGRQYWYMNFYQDCNQPEIKAGRVRLFESAADLKVAVGDQGYRCPSCGEVSTNPFECNAGDCNWKVYGLFGGLGKGIYVYCKDQMRGENIFMPVVWESLPDLEAERNG